MLTSSQITQLSQSIDVLDVMDYYNIAYSANGLERYEALCPFHYEDTASLKIRTDINIWTTFCCNKGHDAFAFMREMEDTFADAIEVLRKLAKIDIDADPLKAIEAQLEEEKDNEAERIDALHYFIGIELRDWLSRQKLSKQYTDRCEFVDTKLIEVDLFFESNPTSEQAEQVYQQILKELNAR